MQKRLAVFGLFLAVLACGQTTQSSLWGDIQDSVDGHSLPGASVECENFENGLQRRTFSDREGRFAFLSLSPGRYRIRVSAGGYQPQEVQEFEIFVASRNERSFSLRPLSDVWEMKERRNIQAMKSRAVLPIIGPDMGSGYDVSLNINPLVSENQTTALSSVIGPVELNNLPLAGRDAYSLLIALGGVNTDAGSGRSLGLTVSGQRPTSSAFRLDEFENNNLLTTGPSVALAPEAIDEYRVSRANFTAEYGGTAGYLANVVSREAGRQWHGLVYYYLRNEWLDANSFIRNTAGLPRPADRQFEPGLLFSGPLKFGRYRKLGGISFFFDSQRGHGEGEPQTLRVPTTDYAINTAPDSAARYLLSHFRGPLPSSLLPTADILFRPDAPVRRLDSMLRMDQRLSADKLRLFERIIINRVDEPNFIWSPYPDFVSPLRQDDAAAGISASWTPRANVLHEMRVGYGYDSIGWSRPYPDIPTLTAFNSQSAAAPILPGSVASYAYRDRNRRWETGYSFTLLRGAHQWKAGGDFLWRRNVGALTYGRDGRLVFPTIFNFYLDLPSDYDVAVNRNNSQVQTPPYEMHFGSGQAAWFVQDEWRISPRLVVNAGVRYEYFGPPQLEGGTVLTTIALGQGNTFPGRIAGATLQTISSGASAYSADRNNFGSRTGVSYRLGSRGPTLRASYGIFYEAPFNNLWQGLRSNGVQIDSYPWNGGQINYLESPAALTASGQGTRSTPQQLLLYQPGIRDPYVQNYLFGLASTVGDYWQWEVNQLGSLGRKLYTTDLVDRPNSVAASNANPNGFFNPALGTFAYRANQGSSNYEGFSATLRRRSPSLLLQASYTWGHAIDNQSDPLAGSFSDLGFTTNQQGDPSRAFATFSRQFDSNGDRGNSNFDQRQDLVILGSWQIPHVEKTGWRGVTEGWRISGIGTVRTGLPFNVFVPGNEVGTAIYDRRADYTGGGVFISSPVNGGVQLLNPAAFSVPAGDAQGNLGRNTLHGPGFYSLDGSLAKSFAIARFGETFRLTFRIDAFNLLNHANLANPANVVGASGFGIALFGRRGTSSSFPASVPLDETPRQIQIGIRIGF